MPRRIAILPDTVADQIAAGEVVERPASAVKELVENAIDAGASRVRIELEQGGKTLIEVSDDGHGMGREDAILALDRHATSKIRSAADLVGVRTFGFRGEALPAIASVSHFRLSSSEGEGEATEVDVNGGRVDQVRPAARQRGTTITVRGLFFNTPARRKFLRSASSESRACWEAVATLALAHPTVGLELVFDGRTRLQVPSGQSPVERLEAVWGPDLARTLVPVQYAVGGFQVRGFIQRPADAQPTGRRTQLFINGRPFRDNFLVRAAEAGYRSAIHPGDRPSLFLELETTSDDVDVNVHPAKLEVRFRDRIGAERAVEEAVRDALGKLEAAALVSGPSRREFQPVGTATLPAGYDASPGLFAPLDGEAPEDDGPDAAPATDRPAWELGPITQLFNTYLVYESADGLVFVDQHSAHERVLYEQVLERLTGGGLPGQRLLLPVTLDLTDEELEVVEQYGEVLRRVGYEVEPFGGRTVALQSVPSPHPRFDAARCFQEMVADLARGRFGGWANRLERFAATYACRAAVKGGDPLDEREQRELLARLFGCALPPHDVHGRATIVQLPREELERRFGRR
ncbi:MAG: DNA mismatch repair endonuclease MutL [Gemmatimonadetes bacterium]|nr:DNA mismatch repair endonuclease MutL [Gemmatimonadota bacterium]MBK7348828.1 DNA mismatch repair endonuclease MutL [Gemmatimonadota bacterium]MBK7714392.1 DNA mismatch repair endonuclease MutL [Gemmatimonadota bacterium]MBK7783457.1 DNA mismatch repair endonuclease MutL [Gemmatimonadota bacterium]MBK7924396.1 DNA mismatch repair endonuclease MutL [Gemmatimonadota bacterium]